MNQILEPQKDYELIDSGLGEKLERFGQYILRRPDPSALWQKKLSENVWNNCNGDFERRGNSGKWHTNNLPERWNINFGNIDFVIRPTSFKHVGIFPEQLLNWQWMTEQIVKSNDSGKKPKILNLFAYTGGASLACAKAGAEVVHLDSSKVAVSWGRENAEASNISDLPIRWIVDDVKKFVMKELKRGSKYDGIILDPPSFGHGPNDELWKMEEDFIFLLKDLQELLSEDPLFFLINGYASGYSSVAFLQNMEFMNKHNGFFGTGELFIRESKSERLLPCGIYSRWGKYN